MSKDKLNFDFNYNSNETNNLQNQLKNKDKISIDDLRRIALWKIDRVLEIPDSTLEKLNLLFNKANLKHDDEITIEVINELTKCKGIGFPMLSAILKFLRPEVFPIIDVRAYRALYGKKIYYSQYNINIYFDYIKKVYEIRDKLNIDLDKVDEQLYEFDKENNGNI